MSEPKELAIIITGGKQYTVSKGDALEVELLSGVEGDKVSFDKVLLIKPAKGDALLGSPYVEGASVSAKILGETKGKKTIIFKKKRRKGYALKKGHRQSYTNVMIESINQ